MNAGLRRLVALAATLAPGRAAALLGRLGVPEGDAAAALATRLAAAPRRTRLAALAAALPPAPRGLPAGHPLLSRLRLERQAASTDRSHSAPATVAARTQVRPPAGRDPLDPPDPC